MNLDNEIVSSYNMDLGMQAARSRLAMKNEPVVNWGSNNPSMTQHYLSKKRRARNDCFDLESKYRSGVASVLYLAST